MVAVKHSSPQLSNKSVHKPLSPGDGVSAEEISADENFLHPKSFHHESYVLGVVKSYLSEFKAVLKRPRQATQHVFNLGCIISSAMMLWKVLMILTGSQSPVVVVLSGSMEPGFYRGDILFLCNPPRLKSGDVVVFQVDGREIPIVHRILSLHESEVRGLAVLTKGDNNAVDDRGLYAKNQLWLKRENIMGTAIGFLPQVGMVTIWLNDYPSLKYLLITAMGFFVFIGHE